MVLLYNDIDDSEIENMDDPEEEQEVYRVKSSINCFICKFLIVLFAN